MLMTVIILIPVYPVGKKTKGNHPLADISSISALKSGRGLSGVDFRYYKPEEYKILNKAQKANLKDYWQRKCNGKIPTKSAGQGDDQGGSKKEIRASIKYVLTEIRKEE